MGLEKGIENGREHRKRYTNSKAFDYSCRNHGGCAWCEGNRLYKTRRKEEEFSRELEEYIKNSSYL